MDKLIKKYEQLAAKYEKQFGYPLTNCFDFGPYEFDYDEEKSLKIACECVQGMIDKNISVFQYDCPPPSEEILKENRKY